MSSKNILSNDVVLKGSIKFSDELILDGTVEGEINSENGHLTVGENARVKGEIRTSGVIVFGKVDGNMTVTERCDLRSQANIIGDIKAGTLSIEEGASFVGQSSVGAAAVAQRPVQQQKQPSGGDRKSQHQQPQQQQQKRSNAPQQPQQRPVAAPKQG